MKPRAFPWLDILLALALAVILSLNMGCTAKTKTDKTWRVELKKF